MNKKNIILAAAAGDYPKVLDVCSTHGLSEAYLCYGITRTGNLRRDRVPAFVRGGVMVLSDTFGGTSCGAFDAERLAGEIIAEVSYRGFFGVLADFESVITPSLIGLIHVLDRELSRLHCTLFVNSRYISETEHAVMLITSQVTGGSYSIYLSELCDRWGASRLALEVIPICMDFPLPAASAGGRILSPDELSVLLDRTAPMPFYSAELAARYFTYTGDDRRTHFVLYDDARTIATKLLTAHTVGIRHAFLLYKELEAFLDEMFEAVEESMLPMEA